MACRVHFSASEMGEYDMGEMKVQGEFEFKISPKINKQKYVVYRGITVLVRWLN